MKTRSNIAKQSTVAKSKMFCQCPSSWTLVLRRYEICVDLDLASIILIWFSVLCNAKKCGASSFNPRQGSCVYHGCPTQTNTQSKCKSRSKSQVDETLQLHCFFRLTCVFLLDQAFFSRTITCLDA